MAEENQIQKVEPAEDGEEKAKKEKPKNPNPIVIFRRWCKACGICINLCPKDVFDADEDGYPVVARPFECTQCSICWLHCPDFAIKSTEK